MASPDLRDDWTARKIVDICISLLDSPHRGAFRISVRHLKSIIAKGKRLGLVEQSPKDRRHD